MAQEQILQVMLSIVAFLIGAVVGSFLNVCVYRIPRGESVVSPRSRCPKCENRIAWYDNIPILSWLLLGAKCRNCGLPISWQYPLVEAITATLFLLVYWKFGLTIAMPIYLALTAALVLATFVDLTDWIIPNEITLPGIPVGIGCALIATVYPESNLRVLGLGSVPVFDALIGAAGGAAFLYGLDKATLLLLNKRGMGLGDVKLIAMLGAFFGWLGVILIIMLASIVGSVVGLAVMMAVKSRSQEKSAAPAQTNPEQDDATEAEEDEPAKGTPKPAADDEDDEVITLEGHYLPFGPYLCLGALLVMFFGQEICEAYVAFVYPAQ